MVEQASESIPQWLTKQVLNMTDDAIYVIDGNLKIVAANEIIEKWSKKNGFTDSIAGKNIMEALPFLDEQAISDIKEVLHSAKPVKAEYTWPLDQNSIVMAHILPLYTQDDNIQVITVAHNLGEKKRIIDAIIKRELAARLLLEQATDGIHIYTIDGVLLYANESLISRLGYTSDEFMKLQPAEIDLSADKKRFPQFLQEMLGKKHILYETVFITKDNQKLSTEVNGTVVQYFGEKAILAISRDVTERRLLIDGLTRGLATLIEAQDVARVGSWDWRIEEGSYEWSSGIFHILELNPQPVNHETLYNYIHDDDVDRIRNAIQKSLDSQDEFNTAFRLQVIGGKEKVVRGIGRVICNEEGRVTRFFGTMTDITEMHTIRQELERSNLDLQIYASFLQHDLRSDLHVITTQAEISKMHSSENNQNDEAIDVITAAANRMSKLLNMFALSTALSRKDIVGMLHLAAIDAQSLNPKLQVEVINNSSSESISVSTGRLLPLVWINLLRNAVNFAGTDALVQITITSDKNNITIDVADNGPGVSASIKHNLFEKGTSTSGSGYGLYLCRKIVEAYGGTIELVDEIKQGATFRVTLLPS